MSSELFWYGIFTIVTGFAFIVVTSMIMPPHYKKKWHDLSDKEKADVKKFYKIEENISFIFFATLIAGLIVVAIVSQ